MTECEHCKQDKGRYDFTRVCCCARLVISARPSKAQQEAMLYVIWRFKGAPPRDVILEYIKASGR